MKSYLRLHSLGESGAPGLLAALLLIAASGCRVPADPDHQGHSHGPETPTVAVTSWTERTELFMEYPVLVSEAQGRAAIHLTALSDFQPLQTGEAVVSLRSSTGGIREFRGTASGPGVFGVDLLAPQAGTYDMTLRIDTPGLQDVHELGPVVVHPLTHAPEAQAGDDPAAITFLKEQQWALDFATQRVDERRIPSSFRVPGTVEPRAGGEALITAPVAGRIGVVPATPVHGVRVRAGTLLASILPRPEDLPDEAGLHAALVEAEQKHELAVRAQARAQRLVDARALPARRLTEAAAAVEASDAWLAAAKQRWDRFQSLRSPSVGGAGGTSGVFGIHAPFDGVVADVRFAPGASVEQDEPLLRLVVVDEVYVTALVPESQAAQLGSVRAAELLRDGQPAQPLGGPLAVSPVVDATSRTVATRFALDNRALGLQIGQQLSVRLFVGGDAEHPSVPEASIVDDGGVPVLFVQTGGETFVRRPVVLGNRAGGYVQILDGVSLGERVVHRGAYLVRLASVATQESAHGHVH